MIAPRGTRPVHYEDIEKQLIDIFRKIIFDPIVDILKSSTAQVTSKKQIFNAPDDELRRALRTGRVQYAGGVFSGKFNSSISKALIKIGAKWNKPQKVFRLDMAEVPNFVKSEAAVYQSNAALTHKAIAIELDETQRDLDRRIDKFLVKPKKMVDRVASDFHDVAKALEIPMDLTPESRERLAADYTNNMKLWIKKWCEEEIVDLRSRVEENALGGLRFDRLVDMIQNRYNVSETKAQFLARQETALFVSKFNANRVKEAGVQMYEWSTSHDERVRDSHKELNGKKFFYDEPPIVDPATGRRANPGEDFNCRCVPIPILNIPLVKAA